MAVNKVNFGGNTLIDLTGDTLESAEQLLKGIIAHAKDGSVITGQMEAGGGGAGNIATGSFTNSAPYGLVALDIMTVDEWKTNYGDFPTTLYAAFFDENPDEIRSGYAPIYCASCVVDGNAKKCYETVYSSNKISYSAKTDIIAHANENRKTIQINGLSSPYDFKPGRTYRWVIIW